MDKLKELIGAQILKINKDSITVKLNNNTYTLNLDAYNGDCCGYADFELNMRYSENDDRNPIITNIEIENKDYYSGDSFVVTFYGENKEIATIEGSAGSGSGWTYGACVSITCSELGLDETLAQY